MKALIGSACFIAVASSALAGEMSPWTSGWRLDRYSRVEGDLLVVDVPAGAKGGIVQSIPAGIQPPTIRDFKVVNGMAYLYLKDTSSAVSYGVAAGQAPGTLKPVSQQPVQGGGNETIIITPATEAAQFYQGIVQ